MEGGRDNVDNCRKTAVLDPENKTHEVKYAKRREERSVGSEKI